MSGFEGCPGSKTIDRTGDQGADQGENVTVQSQLRQWPIQMHLVSPQAPYFQGADVVLVADCVAYAMGNFHNDYLKSRSLAIACPKLDSGQDVYLQKVKSWLEDAEINTLTVLIMEVPCCMGLLAMAQQAVAESSRKVPLKSVLIGIQGDVLREEWVSE
ncbi:MAG: 4Fe-4S ferredoxin [bacterium]|nr:4Fe-4S ferredoxin [bacterium]